MARPRKYKLQDEDEVAGTGTMGTAPTPYVIQGYLPDRDLDREREERRRQRAKLKRMAERDERIRQERARIADWDVWSQEVE